MGYTSRINPIKSILLLVMAFYSAAYCATFDWEFENSFRFFKDANDFQEMKKLYEKAKEHNEQYEANSTGLAFERILYDKWKLKDGNFTKSGWASYFADKNYTNTYWDQETMLYEDGYVHPKSHRIFVWLNSKDDATCQWAYDDTNYTMPIKCSEKQILTIPYDANKTIYPIKYKVNGVKQEDVNISIKDIMIVGLGDSFASGEGNPDKPIKRENMKANLDRIFVNPNRYFPRKEKDDEAKWLDPRAHRSLYSYQFKTALQYAFEHPQQAVTFVSFSSTGAVADNILRKRKAAKEDLKTIIKPRYDGNRNVAGVTIGDIEKDRRYSIRPQIDLLKQTIETKDANRSIDFLLMSIGGNDIGFVRYVLRVMHALPMNAGSKKPTEKTKYEVDSILFDKYYQLDNELKAYLKDQNSSRIILTAYPDVLRDENATLCKGDRREFLIPFGVSEKREADINDTSNYLINPLYYIQKNLAKELGWSFVDGHRQAYTKHGFCAKDFNSSNRANEQFVMPYKNDENAMKWISFQPQEYEPYASKQRWVYLPVDAILMINRTTDFLGFNVDFGFSDETSGAMHPTAEGLAVEADENLKLIEQKFEKKGKQ